MLTQFEKNDIIVLLKNKGAVVLKSEKLTNGLENRKVINNKSDFSLPETSENRRYARKFKNLFDKRKLFDRLSLFFVLIGVLPSYFIYTSKEPVLKFIGVQSSESIANNSNVSILLITVTVLGVILLQLSKPKIPSELTPEEELGLQLYLKRNNQEFEIQKVIVDGEVVRIKNGENSSIFVKYFSDDPNIKGKEIEIPVGDLEVSEKILHYPVRQRMVFIDYPKIGSILASDKIIISKKLYTQEKLALKDIDVLIKRDKSGKHYNIFVNQ